MSGFDLFLIALYGGAMLVLCAFGMNRLALLYLYWRSRKQEVPEPEGFAEDQLPQVAVQLPVFNEKTVVKRLIKAVAELDYPREKLHIQVLDDSLDETVGICAQEVAQLKGQGYRVDHLHREERTGYKAGALEEGMEKTSADLFLILDADFMPEKDLLRRLVPHFSNEKVGMVQARWGHQNRNDSLLTRLQALFLDGHLIIEQTSRYRTGHLFNFNGTAGMWRRAAIEEAGGWERDTITEDMDLSYRSQLKGWKFIFLKDVLVPAELPPDMLAYKSHQHRWAKGATQVYLKLIRKVWRETPRFGSKLLALAHLGANFSYLPLLMIITVGYPEELANQEGPLRFFLLDAPLFVLATLSVVAFYVTAQALQGGKGLLGKILLMPPLLALGAGVSINNGRGVIEALFGHESPFLRTPKFGDSEEGDEDDETTVGKRKRRSPWRCPQNWGLVIEFGLTGYFVYLAANAIRQDQWGLIPFSLIFAWGFGYVATISLAAKLRRWRKPRGRTSVFPGAAATPGATASETQSPV